MLPGPDGVWVSDRYRFSGSQCTNTVRQQAIFGPIAAANHIARAGRRDCRKVRLTVSRGDKLGATLRAAVWIGATEGIDLAIRPRPLTVLVTFVAGHHDRAANRRCSAN